MVKALPTYIPSLFPFSPTEGQMRYPHNNVTSITIVVHKFLLRLLWPVYHHNYFVEPLFQICWTVSSGHARHIVFDTTNFSRPSAIQPKPSKRKNVCVLHNNYLLNKVTIYCQVRWCRLSMAKELIPGPRTFKISVTFRTTYFRTKSAFKKISAKEKPAFKLLPFS